MKLILLTVSILLLSACQNSPRQPALAAAAQPAAPTSMELVERVNDASAIRFDSVEQRITLMQEKLIELNLKLEQAGRQNQLQLATLQQLQQDSIRAQVQSQRNNAASNPGTLDQLTELVYRLEQMSSESQEQGTVASAQSQSNYRLASVYGAKGWVVLKYDSSTGEGWLAEAGDWKPIEEVGVLPESQYQVLIQLAPDDIKGYVAARIDSGNGITWWLKDNQWEPF